MGQLVYEGIIDTYYCRTTCRIEEKGKVYVKEFDELHQVLHREILITFKTVVGKSFAVFEECRPNRNVSGTTQIRCESEPTLSFRSRGPFCGGRASSREPEMDNFPFSPGPNHLLRAHQPIEFRFRDITSADG